MSRSLPSIGSDLPPLVKALQYGILGGLAGTPVSVTFRDFPPDLLSHLWASVIRSIPDEQVAEVWSQVDMQRLIRNLDATRVALLYPSNGRIPFSNVLDWLIERRRTRSQLLPAVLSVYHPNSIETPGATLVICGNDESCDQVKKWLQEQDSSTFPFDFDVDIEQAIPVGTGRLLRALRTVAGQTALSVRDIHIIKGLVSGVVLQEAFGRAQGSGQISEALPRHYSEVFAILNAQCFHSVQQPYDDLTLQMVARANAYLRSKASATESQRPLGGRQGTTSKVEESSSGQGRPCQVTRRELCDLGNPKTAAAKHLVEKLLRNGDWGVLPTIGIKATGCNQSNWRVRPPEANELLQSMARWTYKMVRNRFDRLQSEGLIEVRRAADNAALEYLLPEELAHSQSRFAHLPKPAEVQSHFEELDCPDCPTPAQGNGQAEADHCQPVR